MRRFLLMAFLFCCPARLVWGAAGLCTATTGGPIGGVVWEGAGCRDLLDGCPGCPDSDDILDVNGQAITVDTDATIQRLRNLVPKGRLTVQAGVTLTVANSGEVGGDIWSCAGCVFTVEAGATVRTNAGNLGVAANQYGRVVVRGSVIAKTLVESASPTDDTHLDIRFQQDLPGVAPGDLIRIDGGLARGYTFEITAVSPTDPRLVTVDTTLRDSAGLVARIVPVPGVDERHWTVPDGGPDLVNGSDGGYLGKFLRDGAGHYHPIVGVDADPDGGENDTLATFALAPALVEGFDIAFGFEAGGDPATIFRPARIGATGPNRFYMRFESGARVSIARADFDGVALMVGQIDNANRPLEYFDLSDASIHDLPRIVALQLEPGSGSTAARNLRIERLEVFRVDSTMVNLSGGGSVLRDSMLRDYRYPSGEGIAVSEGTVGATLIEDVSVLRVPTAVASGGATGRPDLTIRRLWGVGRGRSGSTGAGGVIWNGRLIDPNDTGPGKNDGRSRIFNSVLYSHANAEITTPGRSIGQNLPAVGVVTAYSGVVTALDNSDGMYRGDSFYSVHTRHGRHGQTACTWCIGNITSMNGFHGISSTSEACVWATCTPTPFPRRIRGNLSFGNGLSAFRHQEFDQSVEIAHNSLLGPSGILNAAFFDPIDPFTTDICLESDSPYSCGPDTGNGTSRPPWWTEAPLEQPDATLRDNILGDLPGSLFALGRGGVRFGTDDLLHTWNYYFNAHDPDLGEFAPPSSGELVDQDVPFVDPAAYDFRLTSPIPGSDGRNMGAGTAGIVADAAAMPPVFTLLRDAGEILTLRNGDMESVERDGNGKAVFIDFDMTGERVAFAFGIPPACADPRDCADLVIRATPLDGSPAVDRRIRVPVSGAGSSWSVAETALVLGWAGIERPAKVRLKLAIGSSESAEGCWSWNAPPYHIGEYAIPPAAPADLDGDGVRDACDVCPARSDPGQTDSDGDLVGNACDNCPTAYNPDQINSDKDRKGDPCDADDDNDGLSDAVETNTGFLDSASDTGTDPRRIDTDGDGYSDRTEVNFESDPFDAGSVPGELPTLSGTGLAMLIGLLALLAARRLRPRSRIR